MNVPLIIARRRQAILNAWKIDPLLQVQVESLNALPNFQFLAEDGGAGGIDPVGRRSLGNVGIWRRPGDPDSHASVWVRASYDGYRTAYLGFLRAVYQVPTNPNDLAGFDVDHLLNRARSPRDSTFIRIEAIPTAANQRWGALFEKAASDPGFHANQVRERRTMSWTIASKLAGQLPPIGPNDAAGLQRLVAYWVTMGFPAAEVEQGLRSMLDFAYRRP